MTTPTTRSNRLPKHRRMPKQAPPIHLTERDRALLYDLYHFRFLPTALVVARHFGSATRGRNRLKLLFHHGYVDRHFLPTAGPGTGEAIYGLGPAATSELATTYGLEPADVKRRRKPVEPFFIAHELEIARFRIRVGELGAPLGVGTTDWTEGSAATLRLPGGRLTPDAIGWVRTRKARFAFALEVDRGTMTVGRVRAKFDRYAEAAASGALGALLDARRFRLLVIASSTKRLISLERAAREARATNVWLAPSEVVATDFLLEPRWLRPGKPGHLPLFRREQIFDVTQTPGGPQYRVPPNPDS
jgi:hypothetical protein